MSIGSSIYSSKKKTGSSYLASVNTSNKWASALDDSYNKLANREEFSYDQNNDALYQQYAQMYQQNAKLAMEDTVGQVSALTGGYANSYASTAGQAMYNQQMNNLNEKSLEIYRLALQRYNMETDRLMNLHSATATNYGLEQDRINSEVSMAQWNAEFDENQRQYDENMAYQYSRAAAQDAQWAAEYALDNARLSSENSRFYAQLSYDKQRAATQDAQWAKEQAYKQERDLVADSQWQQSFDYKKDVDQRDFEYQKQRDAVSDSQFAKELAYKYASLNSKSSSSSSTKKVTKSEYETTMNTIPNDLKQYLTYGTKNIKTNEDLRDARVSAIETSLNRGDLSEEKAEILLRYYGYY